MKHSNAVTIGSISGAPSIAAGSGSPASVVTANPGSMYLDETNGDWYRKGSGTGNTGWVLADGATGGSGSAGSNGPAVIPFGTDAPLTTSTGQLRWYNDTGRTLTISTVRIQAGSVGPTGASVICDVKINGTTIFSTSGNRPTIAAAAGAYAVATSGSFSTTTITSGQYFTVDIAQVGSTIPGTGVYVFITVS